MIGNQAAHARHPRKAMHFGLFVADGLSERALRRGSVEHRIIEAKLRSPTPSAWSHFSWLGVTVYLTRDANLATLRAVATCGAPGSELVFTYVDQAEFPSATSQSPHTENAKIVAQIGEPWISSFNPDEIVGDLASIGLELIEDLDGNAMWERCRGANTVLGLTACT
jgi:O-methyltransferase involved in polyketide biosynthesis